MKVSVTIPTYNRSYLLRKCLDSLVIQDYPHADFEIIISDNNSTDDTATVANEYIEKFKNDIHICYLIEKRRGLVYVRNSPVKKSNGEILFFGDDDGVYDSNWISSIISVYKKFPDVKAVGSKIDILWDKEPPAWVRNYEQFLGKLNYGNEVRVGKGIFINGGSFSIRKEILLELNGFNPEQVGEDYIGDGESGLCRKMHKKGYLLGWTPQSTMHHLQFVDKNATLKDMKRRFRNNGICETYILFVSEKGGVLSLVKQFLTILSRIPKLVLKKGKTFITGNEKYRLNLSFMLAFNFAQLPYICKLLLNADFRSYISKSNWF